MKKRKSVLALSIVTGVFVLAVIGLLIIAVISGTDIVDVFNMYIENLTVIEVTVDGVSESNLIAMISSVALAAIGLIIAIIWLIIGLKRKRPISILLAAMALLAGVEASMFIGEQVQEFVVDFSGTINWLASNILNLIVLICSLLAFIMAIVTFIVDMVTGKEKKDALEIAEECARNRVIEEESDEAEEAEEVEEEPKAEEPAPVEEKVEESSKEEVKAEETAAPEVKEEVKEEPKNEEVVESPKEEPKKEAKEEKKAAPKAEAAKKETKKAAPVKEEKKAEPKAKEEKKAEKAPAKAKEEKKPAKEAKVAPVEEKKEPAKKDGPTKVYHVSKRAADEKWVIKFAGGEKVIKTFRTKVEACEYADKLAASQGGIVLVHASKGKNAGRINEKR